MSSSRSTAPVRRGQGDHGVAVLALTALLLLPMVTFAAFGVDLASWYSRVNHLQRSADAAALAGTVWMPNLQKARTVAAESLARNDVVDGRDDVTVVVDEGSNPTSLRVTVTDHSATRWFSGTIGGDQELRRTAEAEYFMPLPLGSPLNYFGGDRAKTALPDTTTVTVAWPRPHDPSGSYRPANAACNVGTASSQNLGRWSNATSYSATGWRNSDPQCVWTAAQTTAPANPTTQLPLNVPCNRQQSPTSALGRWNSGVLGALPTYSDNRFSSGTGNRQCQWAIPGTQPPDATTRAPLNAPCWVTGDLLGGSWNDVLGADVYLAAQLLGTAACQWAADVSVTVTQHPNPIEPDRDPGFWAQIEGPGTVTAYGDAYSTRCTTALSCGSIQSNQHRDTGYWYVVRAPEAGTGPVTISVFDAAFRRDGVITDHTGDYNLGASSTSTNPDFVTEYRVFRQTNPLDVTARVPVGPASAANQADNSCWWAVTGEDAFDLQWKPLCTIEPGPGERYLVNVRTYAPGAAQGAGINGYALQAIASSGAQPELYAQGDMGMFNNGSGTFYLAEVGPSFAGKVLAIDLWDPGDVASGTATIYPMMPSASAPRPVANAPATCTYTSSPDPNAANTTSGAWGSTGVRYASPQPSDSTGRCAIATAPTGSAQRFNDEWLRIRIQIPPEYTCAEGLNPETTAGSCWWGIEYEFSDQPYDVTTWKARIEGNPVHLTN
jgi:hypothetical protein